jgi:hypothetical protein
MLAWMGLASSAAAADGAEASGSAQGDAPRWTTRIGSLTVGSGERTATFEDLRSTCGGFLLPLALTAVAGDVRACLGGAGERRVSLAFDGGRATSSSAEPDDDVGRCVTSALGRAPLGKAPCALEAVVSAQPAQPSATLEGERLAAALRSLGLQSVGRGQVVNACDEVVTPEVHAADLGGSVGRAFLIVVGGGPEMLSCYGMTGSAIHLVKPEGQGFRTLYSGVGHLLILATSHRGVRDLAIGGPGFELPVMHWNGDTYVEGGTVRDSESLPPPLN